VTGKIDSGLSQLERTQTDTPSHSAVVHLAAKLFSTLLQECLSCISLSIVTIKQNGPSCLFLLHYGMKMIRTVSLAQRSVGSCSLVRPTDRLKMQKTKRHTRSRALALAAGLVLAASPLLVATSAQASIGQCPNGNACMFKGGNFDGGDPWVGTGSLSSYSAAWNDQVSSIANFKAGAVTWYANSGYWGLPWTLSSGDVASLSNGVYNDAFSSHIA